MWRYYILGIVKHGDWVFREVQHFQGMAVLQRCWDPSHKIACQVEDMEVLWCVQQIFRKVLQLCI